jgi:hypothetical protein
MTEQKRLPTWELALAASAWAPESARAACAPVAKESDGAVLVPELAAEFGPESAAASVRARVEAAPVPVPVLVPVSLPPGAALPP